MESDKYFEAAVNNKEEVQQKKGLYLPGKLRAPLQSDYKPEDDDIT